MKLHLVSLLLLLLLLAAAGLYVVGFGTRMAVALGAALALEIYFWIRWTRVVRGKARPYPPARQAP